MLHLNECEHIKPASFLRTCVSTCPAWQNSATLRRRTQSSPLWSSWTTSITSAPSVIYSMASSTASTTNGELQLFHTDFCIFIYSKLESCSGVCHYWRSSSLMQHLLYLNTVYFVVFVFISPYVIGTMNQGVSSSPNLELHHNFRFEMRA